MTDFLASLFDDPEDDPLEDENVRDGLGWRRGDSRKVKGNPMNGLGNRPRKQED